MCQRARGISKSSLKLNQSLKKSKNFKHAWTKHFMYGFPLRYVPLAANFRSRVIAVTNFNFYHFATAIKALFHKLLCYEPKFEYPPPPPFISKTWGCWRLSIYVTKTNLISIFVWLGFSTVLDLCIWLEKMYLPSWKQDRTYHLQSWNLTL